MIRVVGIIVFWLWMGVLCAASIVAAWHLADWAADLAKAWVARKLGVRRNPEE